MPVVFCALDLYLPYCQSLKEKRRVVKSAADKLRARFNFSIAEIDYQDLWQRSRLGAVSVGANRRVLEQAAEQFIRESERLLGGDLVDHSTQFFEHS